MPNRDQTGPFGIGPKAGRGRGRWCRIGFLKNQPCTKKTPVFAALVPLVGALIKDITNPNGILRYITKTLTGQRKRSNSKKAINANYTILDENNTKQKQG